MTDEEYITTQSQLITFAGLLRGMNLVGFLQRIEHADSMGPILDPTLWRDAHKKMDQIAEIAGAFREAQRRLPDA